jgi:hypothetical protein
LAQIENYIARKEPKYSEHGMLSDLPNDNKDALGHNKAFHPLSRIEFIKNALVGLLQGLFQIHESLFLLNPTMIMQGVPNDLTCFLNWQLVLTTIKIVVKRKSVGFIDREGSSPSTPNNLYIIKKNKILFLLT